MITQDHILLFYMLIYDKVPDAETGCGRGHVRAESTFLLWQSVTERASVSRAEARGTETTLPQHGHDTINFMSLLLDKQPIASLKASVMDFLIIRSNCNDKYQKQQRVMIRKQLII